MTTFDSILISAVLVPIILLILKQIIKRFNPERSTTIIIILVFCSIAMIVLLLLLAKFMGWESTFLQKCDTHTLNSEEVGLSADSMMYEQDISTQATNPLSSSDDFATPQQSPRVSEMPLQSHSSSSTAFRQQLTKNEIDDIYPNVNPSELHPCNFNSFTLSISKLALRTTIKEDDSLNSDLGVLPSSDSSIEVALYNYTDGSIIDEKTTTFYDEIAFESLQDGIYFYCIHCDGYKDAYSPAPFIIDHRFVNESSMMPWSFSIETNDAHYSETFRIQVLKAGNPLQNQEVQLMVYEGTNRDSYMSTSYTTDENGYLQLWHGINNKDYYNIAYFNLLIGCHLMVKIDGDYMLYDVQDTNSEPWVIDIVE